MGEEAGDAFGLSEIVKAVEGSLVGTVVVAVSYMPLKPKGQALALFIAFALPAPGKTQGSQYDFFLSLAHDNIVLNGKDN